MDEEKIRSGLMEPVAGILESHELILEELGVAVRAGILHIRVVVDLPEDRIGSADLETVAEASREISDLLDEDASLAGTGPSELEVTTPGAERELTEPRHFRRSRTRLLRLETQDGVEQLARLEDVTSQNVLRLRPQRPTDSRGRPRRLPEGTPEILEIPVSEVRTARVEIEFSPPTPTDDPSKER